MVLVLCILRLAVTLTAPPTAESTGTPESAPTAIRPPISYAVSLSDVPLFCTIFLTPNTRLSVTGFVARGKVSPALVAESGTFGQVYAGFTVMVG